MFDRGLTQEDALRGRGVSDKKKLSLRFHLSLGHVIGEERKKKKGTALIKRPNERKKEGCRFLKRLKGGGLLGDRNRNKKKGEPPLFNAEYVRLKSRRKKIAGIRQVFHQQSQRGQITESEDFAASNFKMAESEGGRARACQKKSRNSRGKVKKKERISGWE